MPHALVTIDLHQATGAQRSQFDQEMGKRQWQKISTVTTTWVATFESTVSSLDARQTTESDVHAAAVAAGIPAWDAVCMVSDESVHVF